MTSRSSKEKFIKRATKVWGDNRFDYSSVDYINNHKPVIFICLKHNIEVRQSPKHHLKKRCACKKCQIDTLKEIFIKKAIKVWGEDKFNYNNIDYIDAKTPILFLCKKHSTIVKQTPTQHLIKKCACEKCLNEKGVYLSGLTKIQFLKRAHNVHGSRYLYAFADYINYEIPLNIYCRVHGFFSQTPSHHITGKSGCPHCGGNLPLTIERFIQVSNEKHNSKYDYSLIHKILGSKISIPIICLKHGKFEQTPDNHMQGQGCPNCCNSIGENAIINILTTHNILFKAQHTFPDCKYKKVLSFDFKIIGKNICIEYDGVQHFTPVKRFGGEEDFKIRKIRDNIKTEYCIKNNIILYRISYKDDINIEMLKILTTHNLIK
jgi:hypothetical protein